MTRAITVGAAILAVCLATRNSAENLAAETIVSVGQHTYRIHVAGKLLHVAAQHAMNRASAYCTGMKKTVVVKYRTWDLGYGYTLTWSCLAPQPVPIEH